ncbi:MAG: hypothetical protein ACI9UK_000396 [Candidatus Krumholzibacteriia bacterium]|jgi:hypothetical protein
MIIRSTSLALLCLLLPAFASAESPLALADQDISRPDGIHVLDGSYVLDMGDLHMNITNHGLIGSQYTQTFPYSNSPSGEWPGGSGHEYLWGAGLWIGGLVDGQPSVTTGQPEREIRPGSDIRDTIYEGRQGIIVRPSRYTTVTGARLPELNADDDNDGQVDEDFMNGLDDDGDGRIDEDFGQIASQMFTCTMRDDTALGRELYPDHNPMGLKIVQRAATYFQEEYENIVILDYSITNTGYSNISDLYLGMYVDCDIQTRDEGSSNPDDLAGFYRGAVRGSDDLFHRIEVAWMKDAAPENPLPGVFGTMILGHTTDPLQFYAPNLIGVSGYQIFATNALTIQNGEPAVDNERYELMARSQFDRDRKPEQGGDLKFMMSSGPFTNYPPGRTVDYRVAFVIGNGMDEMLRSALKVSEIHRGRYFDMDNDFTSGRGGRESLVCIGHYPPYANGEERLFQHRIDFMDNECTGASPVFGAELINPGAMTTGANGLLCMYANRDNCEECFRANGEPCTVENELYFNTRGSRHRTGNSGRETHVPWIFPGQMPPTPPSFRAVAGDNSVELFWDDRSEFDIDPDTGEKDFESYRVWRVSNWSRPPGTSESSGPGAVEWAMVAEYDLVNSIPAGTGDSESVRSLGRNTGLAGANYIPISLSDPQFEGLDEVMQTFVDTDVNNRLLVMPSIRNSTGTVRPGMAPFLPWEYATAVLDTFFAVTARAYSPSPNPVIGKRSTKYFHHLDTEVQNGIITFYSVVASDHDLAWDGSQYQLAGYGVQSDPENNQTFVTPAPIAQTIEKRDQEGVNIYVYPNPATREALAEFQQQPASNSSPTGVRVMFNNLPAAQNRVKVFTASGDLITSISHDGTTGLGAVSWDLVSRNGQEVVSGVYLYVVESDDDRFETFRGRFTVVR